MVDEAKIDELVKTAVLAELDGVGFLQEFDYSTLCREYNGIGPASLKPEQREKLSRYLALFAPAALIHDMRYTASDLSRKSFNFANMEFRENCLKLANYAYPLWNWRRYRAWAVAELMFVGVASEFGWDAWTDSYTKNLTQSH